MQHIMMDLETLGTEPGCAILSIGAVYFDPASAELGSELYTLVHRPSCLAVGLHEDAGTIAFWKGQAAKNPVHQKFLDDCEMETVAYALPSALEEFNRFVQLGTKVKVWGNGADFDNAILRAAYRAAGVKPAGSWAKFGGRCYRTIKNLYPAQKLTARQGTYHNALDDAKSQAVHLMQLAAANGLKLE